MMRMVDLEVMAVSMFCAMLDLGEFLNRKYPQMLGCVCEQQEI
jgi:hypothetical protein